MAERIAAQRIGGVAADGTSGDDFHVVNPADGSVVATLEWASPVDVDAAVEAAVQADDEGQVSERGHG